MTHLRVGTKHFAIVALLLAFLPVPGTAQQNGATPPDMQRLRGMTAGMSQEQVLEQLRSSGITRAQLKAGLQQYGYDPRLADQYFDAIEGEAPDYPMGEVSAEFMEALKALGITVDPDSTTFTSPWADSVAADSTVRFASADSAEAGPQLFGLDLFRRLTTQFETGQNGPVDPDYRLGPGDDLSLILTGDVESAWSAEVTREGYIVIPDVGQIFVNGLTMAELRNQLFYHLGQRFSGVGRGADAPIQFHVGLRGLRTSVVYVIGEAIQPGAYPMSSMATVLKALYMAGGPSENASFRNILVRRQGQVVQSLDIYGYLLRGDTSDDIRLEHGDVVFLPVSGPRVTVLGAVRRSAIFEIAPGEGLATAVDYAGGLTSDASSHRIQIDRILPPDQRSPGVDRVLIDVDLAALERGEEAELRDGDVVRVFEVGSDRRNRVVLSGEVNRPGVYQWWRGLTLASLVDRADGLSEQAYDSRIHVYRLNPDDGSRTLLRVTGDNLTVGLADRDSIVVHSVEKLANPAFVAIEGFVKEPGQYELARDMTLQDLILTAGGFVPGAYAVEAELARRPDPYDGPNATPEVVKVPLGGQPADDSPEVFVWDPMPGEMRLEAGDHVFVRKAPGYDSLRIVHITGEVQFPGSYALQERSETVSQLFERAGGPTEEAYVDGARLNRGGHLVASDMRAALDGSGPDLALMPGDTIEVPRYDPTVLVTGAVGFESRVRFEAGKGIDYFVDRAGGYAQNADKGRTTVTQHNGERRVVHIRTLFFDSKPKPGPGATIHVPQKPDISNGINWDRVLTRVLSVATAAATVWLAVDRAGS